MRSAHIFHLAAICKRERFICTIRNAKAVEFYCVLRNFHWINEKKKRFINQWHSFVNRHYFHRRWKIRVYNVSFEYVSIPAVSVRVEWKLSYIQQVAFAINFYILFDQCECHSFSSHSCSFYTCELRCNATKNHIRTHTHTHSHWIAISRYTCIAHTHLTNEAKEIDSNFISVYIASYALMNQVCRSNQSNNKIDRKFSTHTPTHEKKLLNGKRSGALCIGIDFGYSVSRTRTLFTGYMHTRHFDNLRLWLLFGLLFTFEAQ